MALSLDELALLAFFTPPIFGRTGTLQGRTVSKQVHSHPQKTRVETSQASLHSHPSSILRASYCSSAVFNSRYCSRLNSLQGVHDMLRSSRMLRSSEPFVFHLSTFIHSQSVVFLALRLSTSISPLSSFINSQTCDQLSSLHSHLSSILRAAEAAYSSPSS